MSIFDHRDVAWSSAANEAHDATQKLASSLNDASTELLAHIMRFEINTIPARNHRKFLELLMTRLADAQAIRKIRNGDPEAVMSVEDATAMKFLILIGQAGWNGDVRALQAFTSGLKRLVQARFDVLDPAIRAEAQSVLASMMGPTYVERGRAA